MDRPLDVNIPITTAELEPDGLSVQTSVDNRRPKLLQDVSWLQPHIVTASVKVT